MLKNKLSKVVSLMLAVMMLMTIIQIPIASATGAEMSVTDTTKDAPFFELTGDMTTTGTNHEYSGSWYALNSELSQAGKTGYIVFSFDGSKSATVDGVTTKIDGRPTKLEFALLTYNWMNYSGTLKYEMSADKENWYTIKDNGGTSGYIAYDNADSTLRAKYSDLNSLSCVTGAGANRNYYTITLPETFTDINSETVEPKYVRIGGVDIKGYCRVFAKPTITWEPSAGAFSVQNDTMVYPTTNDLKLDFSDADISALTKEDLTVAEADGTAAEISEISINENTVGVTFTEALKPYTSYTVTVADTAAELAAYTQSFKTTPAYEVKTFKDTTMEDKTWFTTNSSINPKPDSGTKQYYELGWYTTPRLGIEGNMSTPDGVVLNGNLSEVEFILGYYAGSYTLSTGMVQAKESNNTTIAEFNFADYDYETDYSVTFPGGMSQRLIKIPEGALPRETVSVVLNIGHGEQTVCISKPGITWRDYGLKAEVTKLNGKVVPLNTVELTYPADIDSTTVSTAKFELSDGTNTVAPIAAEVKGNKVVLTFEEALAPETNYTLTPNKDCYSARPYGVIKTTEGLHTSPESITFTTDVAYEEKSFTDTQATHGWLKLNNVEVTSANDSTYCGWYGQPNAGDSSIVFAFDNSGGKKIDNAIYRPDGIIKEIKFALSHFNYTSARSFGISISSDGVNYTSIGTVADYTNSADESLYSDVTFPSFASKQYVSIDSSDLNLDTKYVKIDMPAQSAALCKPSVKYLIPTADYRMVTLYTDKVGANMNTFYADDITVTCQVEGTKAADGYVLIMAAYRGNMLIDAEISDSTEAIHQATFTITDPATEYIKTFLFTDTETITPLLDPFEFGPVK